MKNKTLVINFVKENRKARGWSKTELARICNTTNITISCIELGIFNPDIGLSLLLALAFDCDVTDLFHIGFNDFFELERRKEYINED